MSQEESKKPPPVDKTPRAGSTYLDKAKFDLKLSKDDAQNAPNIADHVAPSL